MTPQQEEALLEAVALLLEPAIEHIWSHIDKINNLRGDRSVND